MDIKLFEQKQVRSVWDEEQEKWYFSIIDVVEVLTESLDPSAYWRKLKQRLRQEGNETVTNCHGLKLKAADGKMRLTDVADVPQLLYMQRYERDFRHFAKNFGKLTALSIKLGYSPKNID